jgi:hypothetical protein
MSRQQNSERSERSQARLTAAHLRRLGELADAQHLQFTRTAARGGNSFAWAKRRVAVVLAQGAARHYLHPRAGYGVKDLDVWTFYARRPDRPLRAGRYEVHADFGASALGRNLYLPPLNGKQRRWDEYAGRRVDFLVRDLEVRPGAGPDAVVAALRDWLAAGAAQPCRHLNGSNNSSAHWLAHKAMVWVGTTETRDRAGLAVWEAARDAPTLSETPATQ